MHLRALSLPLVLAAAGCGGSSSSSDPGEPTPDTTAPVIDITEPTRGTIVSEGSVRVSGTVTDPESGIATVRINGIDAPVEAGGAFSVELADASGIVAIETIAEDIAGNATRDVRAVLAGTLAPGDALVADAMVAKLGTAAFAGLAELTRSQLSGPQLMELAAGAEPLVDESVTCFGLRVDVDSITTSDTQLDIVPTAAGIETRIQISDLDVAMGADFEVLCADDSTTLGLSASLVEVSGVLKVDARDDELRVSFDDADVSFDNLELDFGGLPDELIDLIPGIESGMRSALEAAVAGLIPAVIEDQLASLVAADRTVEVLGQTITLISRPISIDTDDTGLEIALATSVRGIEPAPYLYTPTVAPELGAISGLGLAVADDMANQTLASLWANGALTMSLELDADNPVRVFIAAEVDRLDISLALPPVIQVGDGGELELQIGDIIIEAVDVDQNLGTVGKFAVTGFIGITLERDQEGEVKVTARPSTLLAQVLETSESNRLDAAGIEGLGDLISGPLAGLVSDTLTDLPLPSVAGVALDGTTASADSGYFLLTADLAPSQEP